MEDFLTPISTTVKKSRQPSPFIEDLSPHQRSPNEVHTESPEHIATILKEQPDIGAVSEILNCLSRPHESTDYFNLTIPSPVSAQIADTLVKKTIPDFWEIFKNDSLKSKQLSKCLRNGNGIGAILNRLRALIHDTRSKKSGSGVRSSTEHVNDLLDVLEQVLVSDHTISQVSQNIVEYAPNPIQKKLMWKEFISQICSGRMVSIVAEAEDELKGCGSTRKVSWLASGSDYSSWFGRNLVVFLSGRNSTVENPDPGVLELLGKGLSIGYLDCLIVPIIDEIVKTQTTKFLGIPLRHLKAHEQRKYFNAFLAHLTKRFLGFAPADNGRKAVVPCKAVSGIAALVHTLIQGNELLVDHIVALLTQSPLNVLDDSYHARRSLIALLASEEDKLHTALEASIRLFGDSFYIKHTPILQQHALAQNLVMACSYVQRSQPMFLTMMAKSSHHVSGTSNRIGATSPKARILGIIVGMIISSFVDNPDTRLRFDLEGDDITEYELFQQLAQVNDEIGTMKDLEPRDSLRPPKKAREVSRTASKPSKSRVVIDNTEVFGPRVIEIKDEISSEDEDEDLVPYEKPDSDPEDDTDDPTEIDRNKVTTAPVYIRDLVAGLRDQENYERHDLALSTAASLIRRKANFGTEVSDHIEELATVLTGLNDNLDLSEFNERRQKALIALLLAKPGRVAQWLARAFFSGDYSLTQRVAMLVTMGLGARELAQLDSPSTQDLIPPVPSFPSKELSPHLKKVYAADKDPVAEIAGSMAKSMLQPMAANAADQLSGPDILKVRTFSSRMEVEKRRSKPIPNALAKVVADDFFFPLTGRWWIAIRGSDSASIYTSTHLLPHFLRTLALLLQASGPNTLSLPQMTREFWEMLLSVRHLAGEDGVILDALLFSLLMILETNEDGERLATEQAKELLETQEWVRMVFERLAASSDEEEKTRALAAGVLVRCQEVVDKYQRRMVGAMMDY